MNTNLEFLPHRNYDYDDDAYDKNCQSHYRQDPPTYTRNDENNYDTGSFVAIFLIVTILGFFSFLRFPAVDHRAELTIVKPTKRHHHSHHYVFVVVRKISVEEVI